MEKEAYEPIEAEIILFDGGDVIVTSDDSEGENL